jgi:adenylate cyclase
MFVDVRDSSRLYETMGDFAAEHIIRRAITICARHIHAAQGAVVKNLGDGLLAVFNNEAAALYAAQQIQIELSDQKILRVGIGLHAGQVLTMKDDVYGDVVNVASRLCSLALAGEILTSTETAKSVPSAIYADVQDMDTFLVKGRREPVHVVKVHWNRTSDETVFRQLNKETAPQSLRIDVANRHYLIGPSMVEVTVGRADADILFADQMVSRRHAVIKYTARRFVLTDQSLNGTYVRYNTEQEVFARRETIDIVGAGAIGFGNPPDVAATRVFFRFC